MQEKKDVIDALYKKAVGYEASESVEEYVSTENELILSKRKISSKHIPPDINALKLYLSISEDDYQKMSDEQLELEKQRLLKLLNNSEEDL